MRKCKPFNSLYIFFGLYSFHSTEEDIYSQLMTSLGGSPPVDILVRTSGVKRLSDYMLWQVCCMFSLVRGSLRKLFRLAKIRNFSSHLLIGQNSDFLISFLSSSTFSVKHGPDAYQFNVYLSLFYSFSIVLSSSGS